MAPVGEVSPVWISLHTMPLPGRFGIGGLGRLGGMYCIVCELPRTLSRTPRIEIPPPPQKSAPRRFRSRLATTRELALSFCCRREGESRRIDLVIIDPTDREVFHHNATAAVAEHLCEAALTNTGHLRVS